MCCTVLRIVLILTVFPMDYFRTVFWLYALFPMTWVLATICNGVALLFVVPKELRKLETNTEEVVSVEQQLKY